MIVARATIRAVYYVHYTRCHGGFGRRVFEHTTE